MMSKRILKAPLIRHMMEATNDELSALASFARYQWFIIAVILMVLLAPLYFFDPLPPKRIVIASGQVNSTLEKAAKRYKSYLHKSGVEVELLRTRGAIESLELLSKRKVDVALTQGGVPFAPDSGLVSLGSIGYQPMWFFYKGGEDAGGDLFSYLEGKKISIALKGSGTRIVADSLLSLLQPQKLARYDLKEMSARESVRALLAGEIDGMFLLAGLESGNTQALLKREDIQLASFFTAPALSKKLPYMEVVIVPRGAINLSPPKPAHEVQMIANTTILMVHSSFHPALQHLLMKASSDLYRNQNRFFDRPGGFPAFVDKTVQKSEYAENYVSSGPLALERYAPFWLASFFHRTWFFLFSILAVIYPLIRFAPALRKTLFLTVLDNKYEEMYELYLHIVRATNVQDRSHAMNKFAKLEEEMRAIWVPTSCYQALGHFLNSLELLRARMSAHLKFANDGTDDTSDPALPFRREIFEKAA
jgi:TRAP-type uncharacterized transport system substrate-binding protein